MAKAIASEWPKTGLEAFFDFPSEFFHLNVNLGSAAACHTYHDRWMQRYQKMIAQWQDIDVCRWAIRMRQSLKSSYTATYFAVSARQLASKQCWPAFYYLCYYSTFHSLWSVLFLHPQETLATLSEVTHTKLVNLFSAEFCAGTQPIIQYDVRRLVEDLRYCREYYSYRMPLNSPLSQDMDIRDASLSVGGLAKQCIQLANLQSHLVHKCAERRGKRSARVPARERSAFKRDFLLINSQPHQSRKLDRLDPADQYALREFVEKGCDLLPHGLMNDHMFDEYMTYTGPEETNGKIVARVRRLVGGSL